MRETLSKRDNSLIPLSVLAALFSSTTKAYRMLKRMSEGLRTLTGPFLVECSLSPSGFKQRGGNTFHGNTSPLCLHHSWTPHWRPRPMRCRILSSIRNSVCHLLAKVRLKKNSSKSLVVMTHYIPLMSPLVQALLRPTLIHFPTCQLRI